MIAFLACWLAPLMLGHLWQGYNFFMANELFVVSTLIALSSSALFLFACVHPMTHLGAIQRLARPVGWLLCASVALAASLHTLMLVATPLPTQLEGEQGIISGVVCEDVTQASAGHLEIQRFNFCVTEVATPDWEVLLNKTVRLSCYECQFLFAPGQDLTLRVRFKSKRSTQNFHQPWAWQRVWRQPWFAKGSVVGAGPWAGSNQLTTRQQLEVSPKVPPSSATAENTLSNGWSSNLISDVGSLPVTVWGANKRNNIKSAISQFTHSETISALILGQADKLSDKQWEKLRYTGTVHLVVISGLHLSLIAAVIVLLARAILQRLPARQRKGGEVLFTLLGLGFFLVVIDAGLPATRAAVAIVIGIIVISFSQHLLPSTLFLLVLTICCVLDPFAFSTPGFWLSFSGVALLFLLMGARVSMRTHWATLWRVQVGFFLGLSCLIGYLFGQVPVTALLFNLVCVPLISLLMLPVGLFALLFQVLGVAEVAWLFWWGLDMLAGIFWWIVGLIDLIPWPVLNLPGELLIPLAVVGACGLLHYRFPMVGWFVPLFVLAALLPGRNVVKPDVIRVLDVGQGLAIYSQSEGRTLLYDAGFANAAWSAGQHIVAPLLEREGVRELDVAVASHGDADHAGGFRHIVQNFPIRHFLAGEPERTTGGTRCKAGAQFEFGKFKGEVVWPFEGQAHRRNNASCVIRLEHPYVSILLTGDIEARAQKQLLAREGARLASDILILPHHGSKNAFLPAFISTVAPRVAIASAGYGNAFGHPHSIFRNWLEPRGTVFYNTAEDGAIEILPREGNQRPRLSGPNAGEEKAVKNARLDVHRFTLRTAQLPFESHFY